MHHKARSLRPALILSLLAAAALLALGACGGGGGTSSNARALIDKAFKQSIPSADMTLSIEAKVNGVAALTQPISLKVAGPYQTNGRGRLPSLNWQVSVSGGGQALSGGLISTGDNAFVSFQGTNYQVGKAQIAKINRQLGQQAGSGRSLKSFGIDPQAWVKDPQEKGTESVNGVDTTRVTAGVDVQRMLGDFNKTIQQAGGAMGSSAPQQLSAAQIGAVSNVVKNPKLDLWVGKSDSRIRRLAVSLDFAIPAGARSQFQGAQGGTLNFSIDFAKVGEQKTIAAPSAARPISELRQQLGGLAGLGGSGSGGSGSGGSGSGGSGSGGSAGTPSSAQFQRYSKCLEKANPSNTAAIQKCAQLLK